MEKNKLLLFPFFMGIILMTYSWYLSYPLSIDSLGDFVFNHISPLYWFSLSLLLASMYLMAVTSKSNSLKWIIAVGLIMTMYSLSYFYFMLPGSDAHFFRGLTEYFIETKTLEPLTIHHTYFEWPFFFILSDITTSLSGLGLIHFEFILYATLGFLLITSLYVYTCKAHKNGGFLAVVGFFMMMFHFLNYQCAPFSLAFGLLFLLLMLETHDAESIGRILTTLILFLGIAFTHVSVPLFFVLYEFMLYILSRDKKYMRLFLLTLIVYFAVQVFQASLSFEKNVNAIFVMRTSSGYAQIVEATLAPAVVPIDILAQALSRFVVIVTSMICGAGFIVSLIKRRVRLIDKAVFLSGGIYSACGSLVLILGFRAVPIVFIPISLGASYLFESKFRLYLKCVFLILLILFVFIPLHRSFYDAQIMFQTKEAYQAENFMIDHYNWTNPSLILAHFRVRTYLQAKQRSVAYIEDDFSLLFPRLKDYDSMIYTVGLGKSLLRYNYTIERILREEKLNVAYNSNFSYIVIKSSNFTWTRRV